MKKIHILVASVFLILGLWIFPVMAENELEILNVDSEACGNIFFDGMNKSFSVSYKNNTTSAVNITLVYSVTDIDECGTDTVYFNESRKISVNPLSAYTDTVSFQSIDKYGVYELHINAVSDDGLCSAEETVPFSLCVDASKNGSNPQFATSFHVSWADNRLPEVAVPIVKKSGFSQIRDSYIWSAFETEKGIYTEPLRYTNLYSELRENSVGAYVICAWGNTLYGTQTDSHMPVTDEQRTAFANYVCQVIEKNRDVIEAVEIWNEPDLTSFNPGEASPSDYVKLLKAVHDKVRSNPKNNSVKIAAPALSGNFDWLRKFLYADIDDDGECDSYKYFDILSVHHYVDDYKNIADTYLDIKEELALYNAGDKEIYHTEFGSHQIRNNDVNDNNGYTTERMQASRIARYYLTLHAIGAGDRFFVYGFTDEPLGYPESEKTFGITHAFNDKVPYAAKAALVAVANINSLLYEKYDETCTEYTQNYDGVCVATFKSPIGNREVKAIFRNFNQTYEENESVLYKLPVSYEAEKISFYDMYGNKMYYELNEGYYQIDVTHEPVYVVFDYGESIYMYPKGEKSVVSGNLLKSVPGEYITVKVLDTRGKIVYIEQAKIGQEYDFEFAFKTPFKDEKYTLYLGNKSFSNVYTISFSPCTVCRGSITVVNEVNEEIPGVAEFINLDEVIIRTHLFDPEISDFIVAVAYYNDSELVHVNLINSSQMFKSGEKYTINSQTLKTSEMYNKVKIFLIDSLSQLMPLCEDINLS